VSIPVAALEEIIDTSGIAPQIEVRPVHPRPPDDRLTRFAGSPVIEVVTIDRSSLHDRTYLATDAAWA